MKFELGGLIIGRAYTWGDCNWYSMVVCENVCLLIYYSATNG